MRDRVSGEKEISERYYGERSETYPLEKSDGTGEQNTLSAIEDITGTMGWR